VVYTPSSLTYRVYIVDEVHMLSASAFNALLKTLEEPPAHVIFILATTELQKLPATIVSRCQRFDFRRIATPVLAARLAYIAEQENITLLPEAADRIARMAQGGMRDAISLLELCAGTRRTVDVATVNEMMGSGGREDMLALVTAVAEADYDRVFGAVAEAVNAARDLTVFWQDLLSVYRDLLVVKTTQNAARYLDLTDAETTALASVAGRLDKGRILAHCHLLEEALFAMQKANAARRMVAELTLLRMCDPALDTSVEGILARVERLEDHLLTGMPPVAEKPKITPLSAPVKAASQAPAPAPVLTPKSEQGDEKSQSSAPAASEPARERLRGFVNCVERIGRENALLAAWLKNARAYLTGDGRPLLQLPNAFAVSMVEQNGGRATLARALSAELHRDVQEKDLIFEASGARNEAPDTLLDELAEATDDRNETDKP
jgi:DNA polymerase-3 subunit gamma/tau